MLNQFTTIAFGDTQFFLGLFCTEDLSSLIEKKCIIPSEQLDYIYQYNREYDIHKRIIARVKLYEFLERQYKIAHFYVRRNEYGKLYLKANKNIHFNISYSRKYILIGVSDKCIGVDIEYINTSIDVNKLYADIMHPEEILYFHKLTRHIDRIDFFFDAFNVKEALIKASGIGFHYDIKEIITIDCNEKKCDVNGDFMIFKRIDILPDYKVSIAG